jgi:hypothetical protein
VGAKEQSGRTWPSIFWARGTLLDKVRAGNSWLKHELIQTELNTLFDKVSSAGNIWLKHELIQAELNTLPVLDKLTAVPIFCLAF